MEYYVFAFVAIFIYLVIVKQYIFGRIEFKYVLFSYIFCLVSHYYSLALLPSLLFIVVVKYRRGLEKNISIRHVLAVLSASLIIGLIVYFVSGLYEIDNRVVIPFESVANRSGVHRYTLLSISHINDLFNVIVLLAPLQLLIAILLVFKEKSKALNKKLAIFYLIVIFYFLVFLVLSNTSLTLARDWDIAAPVGLMFAMLLAEMLMEKKMYREALLISIVQIAFLIPWFAVNINAGKSAKRFENVVEYGNGIIYPDYMLSGYEALRKYYEHNNQSMKELQVLKKMVDLLDYPQHYRLFINRNERISVLDNDRYTQNQIWIIKSLVKKRNALKLKSVPVDYSISMNQVDSLLEAVSLNSYKNNVLDRILAALNKDERDLIRNRNSLVGVRAFEEGKLELAAEAFARCLEAEFHDPKIYVLYGSTLERLRELDKAEKILLSGINRFPDNPEVKIALAFIYIRNRVKKEEVRNLLMQAEDDAFDDQQKALIRELKKHL